MPETARPNTVGHTKSCEEECGTTTDFGEATFRWQSFLKIVDAGDGFLFYSLKNLFHWLPFSAFESAACIEHVRDFVSQNGVLMVGPYGRKAAEKQKSEDSL
jgi:hypothetical protein